MPPPLPDDVVAADLDRAARGRLRTLSKDNADGVARHLVMAGRLLDTEPELAYEHAQAAVRRAGRVDVVREAAGITAYRTGRYAEALRELRTVRRLNGSDEHLPLLADCERGLGRPERAIALSQEDAARALPDDLKVELAIVVAGARLDLGDPDAALAALGAPVVQAAVGEPAERVARARADALRAAGREDEADALLATLPDLGDEDDEVVVYDLHEDAEAGSAAVGNAGVRNAGVGNAGVGNAGVGNAGVGSDEGAGDAAGAGVAVAAAGAHGDERADGGGGAERVGAAGEDQEGDR
ncbi:hypothetical protein [Actinotalea solisilvae]|uniref:hypothetical protein n=1 Tax=Actinotalea solisilvae TaxID=2072922 RepID=UPI0018F1C610|nr:hypothetical protein [Actinotalea solisilvae]